MEETSKRWRGNLESKIVTENWSEGNKPSIVEIVCFIESLAESETPLEITELSRGWIRRSMLAITVKPLSKVEFCVETTSSPSTWQEEVRRKGRRRRRKVKSGCGCGGWFEFDELNGWSDKSVTLERMKGRHDDDTVVAAIEESNRIESNWIQFDLQGRDNSCVTITIEDDDGLSISFPWLLTLAFVSCVFLLVTFFGYGKFSVSQVYRMSISGRHKQQQKMSISISKG